MQNDSDATQDDIGSMSMYDVAQNISHFGITAVFAVMITFAASERRRIYPKNVYFYPGV
jgi:hypothetical protein